jgi:DNA-binding response OmpR family regulator
VAKVLMVSDLPALRNEVINLLTDKNTQVDILESGRLVVEYLAQNNCDLLILDSQIGSMGAFGVTYDVRLEEAAGRLNYIPILILLDRRPDVFLAKEAKADGYLIKPVDAIRLKRAAKALLSKNAYFDETFMPFQLPDKASVNDI